jgi:peptidoglycan/LPS O-acetylase OafA/YrhL
MTLLMTLAEKLVQAAGRPAGFDYMRLILALAVVSFHTVDLTYGQRASLG